MGGAALSLRKASDGKCRDCIYDKEAAGTWREQVAQCSCVRCQLWSVRPAPTAGPFANPPRDPTSVSRGWVTAFIGDAKTSHPTDTPRESATKPPAGALTPTDEPIRTI